MTIEDGRSGPTGQLASRQSGDSSGPSGHFWLGWIAGVGAVALVAVGMAAVVHFANRQPSGRNTGPVASAPKDLVRWSPLPASPRPRVHRKRTSPCEATKLRVVVGGGGSAMGTFYIPVRVINTGSVACTLQESALSLAWGIRPALKARSAAGMATMESGQTATFRMAFSGQCAAKPSYSSLKVSAHLNGIPSKVAGAGIPASLSACQAPNLSPLDTSPSQDSSPDPFDGLTVRVDAPSPIVAGRTLDYSVELTNTGNDDFIFGDCPSYTETVTVNDAETNSRYQLNCTGVTIPAGGTTTFDMQVDVPDVEGPARLGWFLDGGQSNVAVTSASAGG